MVVDVVIAEADPRSADCTTLLRAHLTLATDSSPPEHVHALDVDGLLHSSVSFYGARSEGQLVGVGALKELDRTHGELKSMHTAAAVRGRGIGRAMVDHLLAVSDGRGYERVSLETGTMDAFAAARSLYRTMGFAPCEPFGDYTNNAFSVCMTRSLRG